MNETVTTAAPPKRPSRRLGVYAGLWVFAVSLGMEINATLLLQVIFASLTLGSVGFAMVRETKAHGTRGMTFSAALYLFCWFLVMLITGLRPLWMDIVGEMASLQ